MHATERERAILELLQQRGFISFRDLKKSVGASPATLRRDLERMEEEGTLARVRGGAKLANGGAARTASEPHLAGVPIQESLARNTKQKEAIGRAAARLCDPNSAIMMDGGSTTLQMCRHLHSLNLQVMTNSLPIVNVLMQQPRTRVLIPGGSVFREQNIVLSAVGEDLMPRFHAPKLFMGAAAVGARGVMQADVVLVAAERRLIELAEEVILLVDSSKFHGSSGIVVCGLSDIDVVVTDKGIAKRDLQMLQAANIKVVIAD